MSADDTAHPQPAACDNCVRGTGDEVVKQVAGLIMGRNDTGWTARVDAAVAAVSRLTADNVALRARLDAVVAAVIACAYCGGVGAMLHLPGDVVEPCPACGGLRQAIDPEGTAARLRALAAKVDGIAQPDATGAEVLALSDSKRLSAELFVVARALDEKDAAEAAGRIMAAVEAMARDNERLTAWKASAMTEFGGWDRLRPVAESRGARLGARLSDEVLRLWRADIDKLAQPDATGAGGTGSEDVREALATIDEAISTAHPVLARQLREARAVVSRLTADNERLTRERDADRRAVVDALGGGLSDASPFERVLALANDHRETLAEVARLTAALEIIAESIGLDGDDVADAPHFALLVTERICEGTMAHQEMERLREEAVKERRRTVEIAVEHALDAAEKAAGKPLMHDAMAIVETALAALIAGGGQ